MTRTTSGSTTTTTKFQQQLFIAIVSLSLGLLLFTCLRITTIYGAENVKKMVLLADIPATTNGGTSSSCDSSTKKEQQGSGGYIGTEHAAGVSSSSTMTRNTCITFENDIENMISQTDQVFITMPAKAAGTSLKHFVSTCTDFDFQYQYDNFINKPAKERTFLTSTYEMPKVIAFHANNHAGVSDLVRDMTDKSLLVYIHRHENDRLLSAITYIVHGRLCAGVTFGIDASIANMANETTCIVQEDGLVDKIIASRKMEVLYGQTSILTCNMYESIKENSPNMIILNYKQVDRLQAAIAKKYCPDLRPQKDNISLEMKVNAFVKLANTGGLVRIEEWVKEKRNHLEWTLKLKAKGSCQAETKQMENDLFSCTDESIIPMFASGVIH